jgi:hypothetical protein
MGGDLYTNTTTEDGTEGHSNNNPKADTSGLFFGKWTIKTDKISKT